MVEAARFAAVDFLPRFVSDRTAFLGAVARDFFGEDFFGVTSFVVSLSTSLTLLLTLPLDRPLLFASNFFSTSLHRRCVPSALRFRFNRPIFLTSASSAFFLRVCKRELARVNFVMVSGPRESLLLHLRFPRLGLVVLLYVPIVVLTSPLPYSRRIPA